MTQCTPSSDVTNHAYKQTNMCLIFCTVLHKFNTVIVHVEIITYTTRHFSNSWGTFALLQGFVFMGVISAKISKCLYPKAETHLA